MKIHQLIRKVLPLLIALFVFSCVTDSPQTSDAPMEAHQVYQAIDGAVFEVVIRKMFDTPETIEIKIAQGREDEIIEDNYVYEEELPWELVDYSARTDEYLSLGTAFAIDSQNLVTAAHVLSLDEMTFWQDLFIRDAEGQVYPIGKIVKYSRDRDFVQFQLAESMDLSFLPLNSDPQLNSRVFTVGNALGEGVIVRDGLYTSRTFESDRGEWEYLRFSAAASPGNSGGPLLNDRGEVIGIILKKSANENLNYALPISELLDWQDNYGEYNVLVRYSLSIITQDYGPERHSESIDLPLEYREFRDALVEISHGFYEDLYNNLIAQEADHLFPLGEGSNQLLVKSSNYGLDFPYIAAEKESDSTWNIFCPSDIERAGIGDNGFIRIGEIGGFNMLAFDKPDSIQTMDLFTDSQLFMDELLKGYSLSRNIGGQQVRLNSIGEASHSQWIEDIYGRQWLRRIWDIPFGDSQLLSYAIPTPSGYYALAIIESLDDVQGSYLLDLECYLDYLFFSYYGTLQEWEDFKNMEEHFSLSLATSNWESDLSSFFTLENPYFNFTINDEILDVSADSLFTLKVAFTEEEDGVLWRPTGVLYYGDEDRRDLAFLSRIMRPGEHLDSSYQQNWININEEKAPFNGQMLQDDGKSQIVSLTPNAQSSSLDLRLEESEVYTYGLSFTGTWESDEMEEILFDLGLQLEIH